MDSSAKNENVVVIYPLKEEETKEDIVFTFKNKGSLLVAILSWRTLNNHETFPFSKKFFIVEKSSLDV